MRFHIDNMTCGGCAKSVTKAIELLDADARVEAHPPSREIVVRSSRTRQEIVATLKEAGFPPREA